MQSNVYSFIFFIIFWLPFGVVLAVGTSRRVNDGLFYNLAWLAISKSCINSMLYCISNRHFRGAYINLFNYCCCKTTVTFSRRQRPERDKAFGRRKGTHNSRVQHVLQSAKKQRGAKQTLFCQTEWKGCLRVMMRRYVQYR